MRSLAPLRCPCSLKVVIKKLSHKIVIAAQFSLMPAMNYMAYCAVKVLGNESNAIFLQSSTVISQLVTESS